MWFFVATKNFILNLKTTCILFLQFLVWQKPESRLAWSQQTGFKEALAISEVEIVTFTHDIFDMWIDYLSILEG